MAPNNTTPEEQRDRSGDRTAGAGPLIGGTVFVGVITACALVLSYHGLFQLAEYGGHEGSAFAHVFPVTYALLVLMAFWVSYVLRSAPPRDRLWVDVALIPVLILFAGATMAARNLGLFDPQVAGPLLSERVANVIVAVAPLSALLIAILLWITVRAHMRRRNRGTAARPKPSADRTTVLPARRPAARAPEPLKTRLFDLGQEPRGEEDDEDSADTEPLPAVDAASAEGEREGTEPDRVADTHAFARPEEPEEPDAERREARPEIGVPEEPDAERREARPEAGALGEPEPVEARSEHDPEFESVEARPEPEPEAGSLPRRHGGDNPIKRAAEQAPVVPGAAPPSEVEPEPAAEAAQAEPEFHPVVVPDRLADEGFEHQSPVGDPVTDEAEAPREKAAYAGTDPAEATTETSAEPAAARVEAAPPVRVGATPGPPDHTPAGSDTGPGADTVPTEARSDAVPERSGTSTASGVPFPGRTAVEPDPDADHPAPGTTPAASDSDTRATGPGHAGTRATTEPGSDAPATEPDVPSAAASSNAPSEAPSVPDETPVASAGHDDEEEVGAPADQTPQTTGYEAPDDTSAGPALWEPPTEETGGILDDYVPPVWTPPEDDGPFPGAAAGEPESPEVPDGPVPALDHDTGPEVRAAFGRPAATATGASPPEEPERADAQTGVGVHGSVPGSGQSARPVPEGAPAAAGHARSEFPDTAPDPAAPEEPTHADKVPEPAEPAESDEPTESAHIGTAPVPTEPADGGAPERAEPVERASEAPTEEPFDDGGAVRRTAPPPRETPPPLRRTPPPPAKPRSAAGAQEVREHDPRALRKRPMVLKPRRPPIPDLNSGPPSRQVRSEPMRPED